MVGGPKLLIVFGISGVGKTTACAKYAQVHKEVEHVSASQLLEIHRESASARSVKEAMEDQARLVDLVRAYRSISSADVLLLDAHSIIAIGSEHHVIPVGTIRSMKPEGLIFVEASAEAILKRRFSRGDTVDIGAETEDVTRLQAASLKAVKGYSLALNCQLIIVPADQGVDLTEAIANLQ